MTTETLEQIALRVAKETDEWWCSTQSLIPIIYAERDSIWCMEYSRRLVAALGAQEPVAWFDRKGTYVSVEANERYGTGITKLYAAPPVCPTCTQMIDEAARQGRIVDDRPKWSQEQLDEISKDATQIAANIWATIPDGWQLVPQGIHPLYRSGGEGIMELLRNPPRCPKTYEEQDYYAMWWDAMLAAAPEYKP